MQVIGYEFREGAIFQKGAKSTPDIVGKHLDFLRKQMKGELTPEDVLADAKNHNSPLHTYFEWSDSAAAQQHRLAQARGLIRSVVAIYREPDKTSLPVRISAFTHIPEGETSHYRATHHAMGQKHTRDIVMAQALKDLQAWRKKYRELKEFSALFEEVDKVIGQLSHN